MKWSSTQLSGPPSKSSSDGLGEIVFPALDSGLKRAFAIQLLVFDAENPEVLQSAEIIYRELRMHGLKVFFDDRKVARETKLRDAERFGVRIRIQVDAEGLARDQVDVTTPENREPLKIPIDLCVEKLEELANDLAKS